MPQEISLNPYLFFNGRCEEAIEFYRKAVGAEVLMLMRYKDAPPEVKAQPTFNPADANRPMHARLRIAGSILMMADGPCSGKYDGFTLTLRTSSPDEAKKLYQSLSEGGQADMPVAKTFFSPAFGMLTDKFGIKWMVIVETPH